MKRTPFRTWFKWSIRMVRGIMVISFLGMFWHATSSPLMFIIFSLTFIINAILMGWGMFVPNSQLFGYVFSQGRNDRKEIALTFDDGPHSLTTARILDILKTYHVPATFFIVGEKAKVHKQLIERMYREGHEVDNHTLTHTPLYAVFPLYHLRRITKELEECNHIIKEATGQQPVFVRFPAGIKSLPLMEAARDCQMIVTGFSIRAFDSSGRRSIDHIVRGIVERVFPGAIIVLHDRQHRESESTTTIEALPIIIDKLLNKGYRFITLERLYRHFEETEDLL